MTNNTTTMIMAMTRAAMSNGITATMSSREDGAMGSNIVATKT
jgi:hypothetical protein